MPGGGLNIFNHRVTGVFHRVTRRKFSTQKNSVTSLCVTLWLIIKQVGVICNDPIHLNIFNHRGTGVFHRVTRRKFVTQKTL